MSFRSVQKKIAGQGHSMASAGAILANASRHASAAAKRKNPKLNRVGGNTHSRPSSHNGNSSSLRQIPIPFKSKAQQGFLEAHPEKVGGRTKLKEWESATNFKTLPAKVRKRGGKSKSRSGV